MATTATTAVLPASGGDDDDGGCHAVDGCLDGRQGRGVRDVSGAGRHLTQLLKQLPVIDR